MTYEEWHKEHNQKKKNILKNLEGKSYECIVNYFDYDNMKQNEEGFCPLYKQNKKCHNIDNLNCFFCGCPFFVYSDNIPVYYDRLKQVKHYSVCSIKSKFAKEFSYVDNNGVKCINCDCSGCTIPHSKKFVERHIKDMLYTKDMPDSCSFLEELRNVQMFDILDKYKLF